MERRNYRAGPCCEDYFWWQVGPHPSVTAAAVSASGTVVLVLAGLVADTPMSGTVMAAMAALATGVAVIAVVLLVA